MKRTCKRNKSKRVFNGRDKCVYTSKNKTYSGTYDGHFKNGKYDGNGKYVWKNDGATYVGNWKDSKFNGKGVYETADGTVMSGTWKKHKMNGPGKRIFLIKTAKSKPFTQVETAMYKNDKANGKCNFVYQNGTFDGQCKNNRKTFGAYKYKNGNTIIGNWKNNNPHGKSKIQYKTGSVYEGRTQNSNPNGRGTMRRKDGTILSGVWKNSSLNGKCKIENENGEIYNGYCKTNG